jgi:two-component system, cell cycle response regulator
MKNKANFAIESLEILIADDNPTQAERLKNILERHNFKVNWARHGEEALQWLEHCQPAMVISDIIMPEMDGFELCQRIKSNNRQKDIPIILLTSVSSMEDVMRGLKCGADHFIIKPYSEKLLLKRIENILLNQNIKKISQLKGEIEIVFEGTRHYINSEPGQILSLLISTFESAVAKNQELEVTNRQLANAKDLLEKQAVELRVLSLRDELTGLYNRRGFLTLAEHQTKVALRTQTPLFLLFADFDGLKFINDSYGHAMGDKALVATANILQSTYRQADLIARLGGDEFVMLLVCSATDCAAAILERLQEHLCVYNDATENCPFQVSLSVGFSWFDPRYPLPLEDLIKEADEMMYAQKREKKA